MQKLHPMKWLTRHVPSLRRDGRRRRRRSVHRSRPGSAAAVAGVEADAAKIRQLVFDMEKAFEQIDDYTTTMYKQERVKGHLLPREEIQVKFRKPLGLYLKWTGEVNQTREVIYVKGWNDDKIRAHKGSFPDMTVNLRRRRRASPCRATATRSPRAHFGHAIGLIARDARLSESRPQDNVRYLDHGEKVVYGARSRCIEARTPAGGVFSVYYAARAKICFDVKTRCRRGSRCGTPTAPCSRTTASRTPRSTSASPTPTSIRPTSEYNF